MNNAYIPGVCNIGPTEIAMRKRVGWIGLAVAILLWVILAVSDVSPYWRFLLVFPASMSTMGFLQAYLHFCAGFGMRGLLNFGPEIGKTETVEQQEFRKTGSGRGKFLVIQFLSALLSRLSHIMHEQNDNYQSLRI